MIFNNDTLPSFVMIYFILSLFPLFDIYLFLPLLTQCSFYKSNYVQRFHYSRPVRKGPVDPNNEFVVSYSFLNEKIYDHRDCGLYTIF